MTLDLTGRIDARATDGELASLFGWPASASTRLTGSLRHPGVAALDGDDGTAWITAFGAGSGATLSTTASTPITMVEVRQPTSGFSRATELTARAAGEERVVRLEPDAAGTATAVIEPALPPGPVEFVLSQVDEEVTIDRRFADPVILPVSIVELRFDGQPTVEPLGTAVLDLPCTTVAEIDGVAVTATIDVDDAGWLDGEPIELEPCDRPVRLGAGRHLIEGSPGPVPITLDRVVLDDGVRAALDDAAPPPPVDVVSTGRVDRTVRVGPCPDGCWLVLGEGVNDAWSASGPEGDLGAPVTVDGGFNGWWIAPSDDATVVELRWTAQWALDWALVLSALGAVSAVWLVVRGRVRRDPDHTAPAVDTSPPLWSWGPATPVGRRQALVVTTVWVTASLLLVGPVWALCGLLGGAAIILMPRHRLVELTALASLMVVAAIVVVRERRTAPPPNGAWPGTFESLHGLGMFAVACVVVAALIADDDDADDVDDADRGTELTELTELVSVPADPRTATGG
jgi:arabinofuranan 3-O-arabinosyltransferase